MTLFENYRKVSKTAASKEGPKFQNNLTSMHFQSMCDHYMDTCEALATGNLQEARSAIRRALDERTKFRSFIMQ